QGQPSRVVRRLGCLEWVDRERGRSGPGLRPLHPGRGTRGDPGGGAGVLPRL
ncbi:MAG: hypothetical protein AVDCRST_MAG55-2164, partial [uncultured Rubrobacteraceae bacterium]